MGAAYSAITQQIKREGLAAGTRNRRLGKRELAVSARSRARHAHGLHAGGHSQDYESIGYRVSEPSDFAEGNFEDPKRIKRFANASSKIAPEITITAMSEPSCA